MNDLEFLKSIDPNMLSLVVVEALHHNDCEFHIADGRVVQIAHRLSNNEMEYFQYE